MAWRVGLGWACRRGRLWVGGVVLRGTGDSDLREGGGWGFTVIVKRFTDVMPEEQAAAEAYERS